MNAMYSYDKLKNDPKRSKDFAFLFKNIDIQVLFNMCTFNETGVVISLHCVSCYKILIIDTSNMQKLISVLLLLFDSSHALQNIIWAVWHGFRDYFLTLWSMYLSFVMRYLSKHTLWIVLHFSRLIFRCFQVISFIFRWSHSNI